jgi:hypothetical protein
VVADRSEPVKGPLRAACGGALRPSLDRTMTGPPYGTQVGRADLVESRYDQEKGWTQCKPSQ